MSESFDPWARVHALLDARCDPLADPAICAWLENDAGALQALVELRARLAEVARPAERSPGVGPAELADAGRRQRMDGAAAPRGRRLRAAAAATSLVVAVALVWAFAWSDRWDARVDAVAGGVGLSAAGSSAATGPEAPSNGPNEPNPPAEPEPLPLPTVAVGQHVRVFSASTLVVGDDATLSRSQVERGLVRESRMCWRRSAGRRTSQEISVFELDLR
ncbi:MAG: hypothetical protein R3F56_18975 [Planctomycetota bacterium]